MQETSKYQFNEGVYNVRSVNHTGRAYVTVHEDSVKVYPMNAVRFDSTKMIRLALPEHISGSRPLKARFVARSFDVDVLTILFKYRPAAKGLPNQFSTQFNGAGYLGYRSDVFNVAYKEKPLYFKRRIQHYGYSVGGFLGIGATAMNPWVTQEQITEEYDGLVLTKGVALHLGVNSLNFGVALGWDHLMDRNRKLWIYQGKPWTGVTFGLNLN